MNDPTPISFGALFERLGRAQSDVAHATARTSEPLERDLGLGVMKLGEVIDDILVALREHFACHDCNVPEHYHDLQPFDRILGHGAITSGLHPVTTQEEDS